MMRRCSHCNNNGHNSRTCPNRGVRLFGVRLTDGPIRKSASMGNLTHYAGSTGGASPADGHDHGGPAGPGGDGYASEDFAQGHSSSCRERKKGVSWTEEEHRMFLVGLQKLGKGDWRGIARNYVVSRTPTQVASHAQKYFIRQTNASRRKRRTSLFDMVPDEPLDPQLSSMSHQEPETQGSSPLPLPALPALDEERAPMDSTTDVAGAVPNSETAQYSYPVIVPAFFPPFFPCPVQFWPGYCGAGAVEKKAHEIVKPMAMHPKAPIMIDDLRGMSQLSLGEPGRDTRPPFLSPKLPDGSDRQSAFHSSTAPSNRSISAV